MTTILNLTPHPLNISGLGGHLRRYPIDGPAPRLSTTSELIDGLPVVTTMMRSPDGLPDQAEDTFLVVSALVSQHASLAHRTDLMSPGALIRDALGRVVGSNGFTAGLGMAQDRRALYAKLMELLTNSSPQKDI